MNLIVNGISVMFPLAILSRMGTVWLLDGLSRTVTLSSANPTVKAWKKTRRAYIELIVYLSMPYCKSSGPYTTCFK